MKPTPAQSKILAYLAACAYASSTAVARMLWGTSRRRQSAIGILHRMQDRGWVQRRPQGTWELTEAGREASTS